MRRILYYSLLCLLWFSVNSCKDEEASQPPAPSFTVDKTAGLLSDADHPFTFTVEQVGAGSVSLLPYGVENPSYGGVLIPASSFSNGKATVTFAYEHVGTFQAVAVASNHSGDGKSVKNSYSSATAITITSDKASLSDFSFDGSTKTTVDDSTDPVSVLIEMPWSKFASKGALKLRYSASAESTVTVDGNTQSSDGTANDFSTPVTYTVTSQDGNVSKDYLVTVHFADPETNTDIKAASGIVMNKGKINGAVNTGRVLPGYIDNTGHYVVLYDKLGSAHDVYDSLALDYALDGSFSNAKYTAANWGKHAIDEKVIAKDTIDLSGDFSVKVTPEDSVSGGGATSPVDYDFYVADAPKMQVMFRNVTPSDTAESTDDFGVTIDVLNGTTTTDLDAQFAFSPENLKYDPLDPETGDPELWQLPADASIVGVKYVADDGTETVASDQGDNIFWADGINLKKGGKVLVTVHDDNNVIPDYVVTYTIGLSVK